MVLICIELPVTRALNMVMTANSAARGQPNFRNFSRFSMTYMGPPIIVPSDRCSRYLCDRDISPNLMAIPKKAVIHIQNSAAGPPVKMATATPPMLPVPTVPESAEKRAWRGLMSPSPPLDRPLPINSRQPAPRPNICGNPSTRV